MATNITYRQTGPVAPVSVTYKGTTLTFAEMDGNLKSLADGVDSKQPTLVSGTNIATINGNNLLLGGNIDLTAAINNYTKQQYFGEVTLTYNATQTWDVSVAQVAKVTLTGNVTFSAPTNQVNGAFYSIAVIQDGTGSRTAAWNSVFKFTNGTAPTLSTAAGAKDYFTFRSDGTNMYEQGRSQGVA